MIDFGFIFDWLRRDVERDSPNSNNIIFRIKVLRIMKLMTKMNIQDIATNSLQIP